MAAIFWKIIELRPEPFDFEKPTQCLVNVGPASPVLASIHSALVSTSCWRYWHNALNQSWVNVGPSSVTLAHIQRGAKHDTVSQYWANVGSAS